MLEALSKTPESGDLARTLLRSVDGRLRMVRTLRALMSANPELGGKCSALYNEILKYPSQQQLGNDVSVMEEEIARLYTEITNERASAPTTPEVQKKEVEPVAESVTPASPAASQRRRDGPFLKIVVDNTKPAQEKGVEVPAVSEQVVAQAVTEEVKEEPVVETTTLETQEAKETAEVSVPVESEVAPDVEALRHEVEHIHKSLQGVCSNPLSLTGCEAYKKEYIPARIHIVDRLFDKNVNAEDLTDVSQKIEGLRNAAARVREEFGVWESGSTSAEVSPSTGAQVVESIAASPTEVVPQSVSAEPAVATTPEDHKLALIQMMKSKEIDLELKGLLKRWAKGRGGLVGMFVSDPEALSSADLERLLEEAVTIEQVNNNDLPIAVRKKVAEHAMQNIATRVELFAKETGVQPNDAETLEYYLRRALSLQRLAPSASPLAQAA